MGQTRKQMRFKQSLAANCGAVPGEGKVGEGLLCQKPKDDMRMSLLKSAYDNSGQQLKASVASSLNEIGVSSSLVECYRNQYQSDQSTTEYMKQYQTGSKNVTNDSLFFESQRSNLSARDVNKEMNKAQIREAIIKAPKKESKPNNEQNNSEAVQTTQPHEGKDPIDTQKFKIDLEEIRSLKYLKQPNQSTQPNAGRENSSQNAQVTIY
jgi:hypothetical protein